MAITNPYSKYNESKIFNASQEELTLMLFDGALKFCNQGMYAIEAGEVAKAHGLIIRVQDIIEEFQITLDTKYAISQDFARMFEYIHRRLVEANAAKNISILEEVRDLLRELRDVWKQAMQIAKNS